MFFIMIVINFILYGTAVYYFMQDQFGEGLLLVVIGIIASIITYYRYRDRNVSELEKTMWECGTIPLDCIDCDKHGHTDCGVPDCGGADCNCN